jgi:hypothetical protein
LTLRLERRLLVSLIVLGLALAAIAAAPSTRLPRPPRLRLPQLVAPTPPKATTSRYMETVDTARSYTLGCQAGNGVDAGKRPADGVIVLDYGKPVDFGNKKYGASLFDGADQRTRPIRLAVQEYAHGFWACTDGDTARLTLAVGTSNFGSAVTFNHGKAWAGLVNEANHVLQANGWSKQVVVLGAIDLELSWSSPTVANAWLDGYDSKNEVRVLNYGDAAGCPPATSSCGTSSHPEWDSQSVWYAAWGHPSVWPLPEIYLNSGIMAEQWHQIAHHGITYDLSLAISSGAMTQSAACAERGCDSTTDNTPQEGWTQLWNALNDADGTDQTPKWSTDISWGN